MAKTVIGKGKELQTIILRETSFALPEYLIITYRQDESQSPIHSNYSTKKIEGHYILLSRIERYSGDFGERKILGIEHKIERADSRLINLAREEFNSYLKKARNEKLLGKETFIDETARSGRK